MSYRYLYRYRVSPEQRGAFESFYGPDGSWVELFRQAPGYRGTVLLRDLDMPDWYLTVDEWASEQDFKDFRANFSAEFERLDAMGEQLTQAEAGLGRYRQIE